MLAGVTPQWLRSMFSRIAPRYDLTNTVISAGLDQSSRQRLAQCVARHVAQAVVDVPCGTGGVIARLTRCCPPTACPIGVDCTEAILSIVQERVTVAA